MVPPQLGVIPLYMMIAELGWADQLQAVILPDPGHRLRRVLHAAVPVEALPNELIEAARVDGAQQLRIVWHVVFPAARPAMAVLGMLTFVQAWNDFFWPIIVLRPGEPHRAGRADRARPRLHPRPVVIMAGALLGTLPLLLVFVLFGKQIVGGIMQGAVKG